MEQQSPITVLKDTISFPMWKHDLDIYLGAKDLMDLVDGTETLVSQGDDASKRKKWKSKDSQAKLAINGSLDQEVKAHILTCADSKSMYDTLMALYQQDAEQTVCTLMTEFTNFKFDKKGIMGGLSRIKNICYKLEQLKNPINEKLVIIKIISVLPSEFNTFSTAWEATDDSKRTLNELCARLQHEENKYKNQESEETSVAFKSTVQDKKNTNGNQRPGVTCYKCKKTGHYKSECKNKYCGICKMTNHNEKDCRKKDQACTICKKLNHKAKDCKYNKNKVNTNEKENSKKVAFIAEIKDKEEKKKNEALSAYTESFSVFTVDSGSTDHMVNKRDLLSETKMCDKEIKVAKKGASMAVPQYGNLEAEECDLKTVYYVPELTKNLLSVSRITRNGGAVLFSQAGVEILKTNVQVPNGLVVMKGEETNGLFEVRLTKGKSALVTEQLDNKKEGETWHKKLGHITDNNINKLTKISNGLPECLKDCKDNKNCKVCAHGKQTRKPFKTIRERGTRPLDLIHADLCGPIDPESHDGNKYFLTVLDDYSHFCRVYPLKSKDHTTRMLKSYILESENKHNLKTAKIRMDNGKEFVNNDFKTWCEEKGIVMDLTIPHTPQLNGKAERIQRTIMDKARCLILDSKMDKEMWSEAVLTATYLISRSPSHSVEVTPYELWNKKKPDLSRLQIFGAEACAKRLGKLKKLDDRSADCIFVGYGSNGLRMWNPKTREIFTSRDVDFMNRPVKKENLMKQLTYDTSLFETEEDENNNQDETEHSEEEEEYQDAEDSEEEDSNAEEEIPEPEPENRRQRRNRRTPNRFNDFILEREMDALLTYTEALEGEDKSKWKKAIDEEKQSLHKNNMWELVNKEEAKEKEILSTRWLFKVKEGGRYKARLVVRGCQQKKTLSHEETFSPIVDSTSLRILSSCSTVPNHQDLRCKNSISVWRARG